MMNTKKIYKGVLLGIFTLVIGLTMSGCDLVSYSTNGAYQEKSYTTKSG